MECVGSMSDEEWSCFSGMYSTEEADFMAQLLGKFSLPNELPSNSVSGFPCTYWPGNDSDVKVAGAEQGPIGSSYSTGDSVFFPTLSTHQLSCNVPNDCYPILTINDGSLPMEHLMVESQNMTSSSDQVHTVNQMISQHGGEFLTQDVSNESMESGGYLPEEKNLQLGKEDEMPVPETALEDKADSFSEKSKKRSRIREDVQKSKRIAKPKKKQKLDSAHDHNNDESNHQALPHQQSSSSCISDDESNASEEFNGAMTSNSDSKGTKALNLNVKTRANRGSATDPQSLYARKRRERINERLRILQNLVPNGTKVDISTMLEEAVQYVKLLQLQIKLLSSNDLWMYAPIAYNGMNIGLDLNIGTPKS